MWKEPLAKVKVAWVIRYEKEEGYPKLDYRKTYVKLYDYKWKMIKDAQLSRDYDFSLEVTRNLSNKFIHPLILKIENFQYKWKDKDQIKLYKNTYRLANFRKNIYSIEVKKNDWSEINIVKEKRLKFPFISLIALWIFLVTVFKVYIENKLRKLRGN